MSAIADNKLKSTLHPLLLTVLMCVLISFEDLNKGQEYDLALADDNPPSILVRSIRGYLGRIKSKKRKRLPFAMLNVSTHVTVFIWFV